MEIIRQKATILSRYFDIGFTVRFLALLLCFYFLNLFLIQVANPRSAYFSRYLSENLHYVNWLRLSILETSNLLANAFGLDSYLQDEKTIRVRNGHALLMARQCLGLEITSFWIAFVVAHAVSWKKKVIWVFTGIITIWLINVIRVAVLLYARQHQWKVASIDQHDLFNYIAYALIAGLIYLFYKKGSSEVKGSSLRGT